MYGMTDYTATKCNVSEDHLSAYLLKDAKLQNEDERAR